jgi:hypothetical protein
VYAGRPSIKMAAMAAAPAAGAAVSDLHLAVEAQALGRVIALLEATPALADACDLEGQTPLHWAAAAGDLEVVRQLCQYGANVWAADAEGQTAVDLAASKEIETYLQAGACELTSTHTYTHIHTYTGTDSDCVYVGSGGRAAQTCNAHPAGLDGRPEPPYGASAGRAHHPRARVPAAGADAPRRRLASLPFATAPPGKPRTVRQYARPCGPRPCALTHLVVVIRACAFPSLSLWAVRALLGYFGTLCVSQGLYLLDQRVRTERLAAMVAAYEQDVAARDRLHAVLRRLERAVQGGQEEGTIGILTHK